MNVKTLKNIAAVACVTALAVPAGVAAKGPSGDHGKSGDQHGQSKTHVNKRCKHQPMVGYNARGTLDTSSTAESIVVNITKVNSGSKDFKVAYPKQVTISGDDLKKVTFEGANPFTTQPAPDLTKYTVHITGKAPKAKKGCTPDTSKPATIKKVQVKAPDATPEQPEQPETQTQTQQ